MDISINIKRISAVILILALIWAVIYGVRLIWFRPADIDHFFERFLLEYVVLDPEQFVDLDPAVLSQFSDHQARLDEIGPGYANRRASFFEKALEQLDSYDPATLTGDQQIDRLVLKDYLETQIAGKPFSNHRFLLAPRTGVPFWLLEFLSTRHPVYDEEDGEAYLRRLRLVDNRLEEAKAITRGQISKGILPPLYLVQRSLAELRRLDTIPVQRHPLYISFARRAIRANPTRLNETQAVRFLGDISTIIERDIKPAYRSLIPFLDSIGSQARPSVAAIDQPSGDAYLAWSLKANCGFTPDLEESKNQLRRALDSLQTARATWVDSLQKFPGETAAGIVNRYSPPYAQDPVINTLRLLERSKSEIKPYQEGLFERMPPLELRIRRLPGYLDGVRPWVSYENALPPEEPFSRVLVNGSLCLDQSPAKAVCKFYMEGMPGKYVPIAWLDAREEAPRFRYFLAHQGYLQGWGLFSTYLLEKELYFLRTRPAVALAWLHVQIEALTLALVDLELHTEAISLEEAKSIFLGLQGFSENQALEKLDIIISNPGQTSAGPLVYLRMQNLQKKWQEVQGEAYYPQAYYQRLVGRGPLTLSLLTQFLFPSDQNSK